MRILVTGVAGFIGAAVARALIARGDEVVGIDDFNDFYDPAIKERRVEDLDIELVRGSILDEAARDKAFATPLDAVIHLAAWAGVRPSIERPMLYQQVNVEGTQRLLEAARETKPKFIFASSSSVYGNNDKTPFHEDDRVDHPISPYAATKRAGELIAYTYHHLFEIDVTALRFFTVYGPGQRPDLAIHKFAKLLLAGEAIPRFGDGSTSRDYTFIDDTVDGVLRALDRCEGWHLYNLGNASPVSLNTLIDKLGAACGVTPRIETLPDQPGDVRVTYADIARAKAELGYLPSTSLDDGLAQFVAWLRG